jgi:hypothetical protein
MEILCPILLVLVGLLVSKVDVRGTSGPKTMDIGIIGKQKILYGAGTDVNINNLENYYLNMKNVTSENLIFSNNEDRKSNIRSFYNKVFENVKDKEDCKDHK